MDPDDGRSPRGLRRPGRLVCVDGIPVNARVSPNDGPAPAISHPCGNRRRGGVNNRRRSHGRVRAAGQLFNHITGTQEINRARALGPDVRAIYRNRGEL